MFHTAGYFRSTLCPFYEHGLCHRPHCHYSHKIKSSSKSSSKKVHSGPRASHGPGQSSSSEHTRTINYDLSKIDNSLLEDVATAVSHVTNFFGSSKKCTVEGAGESAIKKMPFVLPESKAVSGRAESKAVTGRADSKAVTGRAESKAVTGRAESKAVTGRADSKAVTGRADSKAVNESQENRSSSLKSIPCYAPEKLMETYVDPGDGPSLLETTTLLPHVDPGDGPSLLETTTLLPHVDPGDGPSLLETTTLLPSDSSVTNAGTIGGQADEMMKSSPTDHHSDSCHGDDVENMLHESAVDVYDLTTDPSDDADVTMETSEIHQSQIEAEFQKMTTLPDLVLKKDGCLQRKRKREDDPYGDLVNKRWQAHDRSMQVTRESLCVTLKPSTVTSNFSDMLSNTNLFMGKKRTAITKGESSKTSAAVPKRPKLSLTVNAKIPTQLRQRFLDAFIDEHLKISLNPQDAYSTCLREEKDLFDRSNGRMVYMSHSSSALKKLRDRSKQFLEEQQSRSDSRVKHLTSTAYGDSRQTEVKRVAPRPAATPPAVSSKVWADLESELQSTIFGECSQNTETVVNKRTQHPSRDDRRKAIKEKQMNMAKKKEKTTKAPGGKPKEIVKKDVEVATVSSERVRNSLKLNSKSKSKNIPVSVSQQQGSVFKPPSTDSKIVVSQPVVSGPVVSGPALNVVFLESELFGDSDSDGDNLVPVDISKGTKSHDSSVNTMNTRTSGTGLSIPVSATPTSLSIDKCDEVIEIFDSSSSSSSSSSSDALEKQSFESALTGLDAVGMVTRKPRETKSTRKPACRNILSLKRKIAGNRLPQIEQVGEPAASGYHDDCQTVSCDTGRYEQPVHSLVQLPRVPVLKLVRTSLTTPPHSACQSPVTRPSAESAPSADAGVDIDLCTLPENNTESVDVDLQTPPTSLQSSSVSSATLMDRSSSHCFLPSGPLICLTDLAAKQKSKVTDLACLARAKGNMASLTRRSKVNEATRKHANKERKVEQQKPSLTILKKREIVMTPSLFYEYMCNYLLTEQQLVDNGYPRLTSEVGVASIDRGGAPPPTIQSVGVNANRHYCCRCNKPFVIYDDGRYQTIEECIHHYGRLIKSKEYGEGLVSLYTCCQGRRGSDGCQWAKLHVTSGERQSRECGYVTTRPSSPSHRKQCVYAVDCEMCYTTVGLQLTRVSVIDIDLRVVYESLVQPSHPIVDYNTRFSGLKAEDFVSVTTSLSEVQECIVNLVCSETILIGHSLESDLRSLKVIHSSVVDTALVFPHKKGLPFKRSLKALMVEYMRKFIQNNVDGGHDSLEDSRSCMELMIWKVNGDLKRASRRSSDSACK